MTATALPLGVEPSCRSFVRAMSSSWSSGTKKKPERRVGEVLEHRVRRAPRGRQPPRLKSRLVERHERIGEKGVVLQVAVELLPVPSAAAVRESRPPASRTCLRSQSAARPAASTYRVSPNVAPASAKAEIMRPFQAVRIFSSRPGQMPACARTPYRRRRDMSLVRKSSRESPRALASSASLRAE